MNGNSFGANAERSFGEQVRHRRSELGWSQQRLARHLRDLAGVELNQSGIARLESGERATRLGEAVSLSSLLGIDLQALVPVRAHCPTCLGTPPRGFTCNDCGAGQ